jgi:hypothetical protein
MRKTVMYFIACLVVIMATDLAWSWTIMSKWSCCGTNPRERVQVRCQDGRAPVYVKVNNQWCLKKTGAPDEAGPCFATLDQAARAWCDKAAARPPEPLPTSYPRGGQGWKLTGEWKCCGNYPRQRVNVTCSDGRMPTYVYVTDRWCLKKKSAADEAGPCFATLDQAARAWCNKGR